jgi:hypothetical protein
MKASEIQVNEKKVRFCGVSPGHAGIDAVFLSGIDAAMQAEMPLFENIL